MSYFLLNPTLLPAVAVQKDHRHRIQQNNFNIDIEKTLRYYRHRTQFINNKHILIRMIELLFKSDESVQECYKRVAHTYRGVCATLMLGTYATVGKKSEDNYFYQNSDEFIYCSDEYFAVTHLNLHWQDYIPVAPMVHEVYKMNFIQPGELCRCDKMGYSVIRINPVMLMCMYNKFYHDTISANRYGYHNTPKEFVTRFVLPNMLLPHCDLVVSNMIYAVQTSQEALFEFDQYRGKIKQPFYIVTDQKKILQSIKTQLNIIRNKTLSVYAAGKHFEMFHKKDLYEAFKLPILHRSVQLDWYYALIFLKRFETVLTIVKDNNLQKKNRLELYNGARELIRNSALRGAIKMTNTNGASSHEVLILRASQFAVSSNSFALKNILQKKIK